MIKNVILVSVPHYIHIIVVKNGYFNFTDTPILLTCTISQKVCDVCGIETNLSNAHAHDYTSWFVKCQLKHTYRYSCQELVVKYIISYNTWPCTIDCYVI